MLKNFCILNGTFDNVDKYTYTSPTTGLIYEWDMTNVTVSIQDQSEQYFSTTIVRNNAD